MFDMTKCRAGDKLKLRNGDSAVYLGRNGDLNFPHDIYVPSHKIRLMIVSDTGQYVMSTSHSCDVVGYLYVCFED